MKRLQSNAAAGARSGIDFLDVLPVLASDLSAVGVLELVVERQSESSPSVIYIASSAVVNALEHFPDM